MGKKDDEAIEVFLSWARDDAQVRKWQREVNLRKLLGPHPQDCGKAGKGRDSDAMLVQIKGVLPPRIADGAAAILARIADSKWNTLEWDGDPGKPALDGIRAAHRFGAVVDPSDVHGGPELLKALSRLMPPADNKHSSFHLGRFEEGDFLAPQNDAAFCAVDAGTKDPAKAGQILKCSRDVGVMLFLSKHRKESDGGLFRDLYYQHRADHKGMSYVPEFNSLIAYHVPRQYEVTPILSEEPLLSVFGWYLQEGELYDLKPPTSAEIAEQNKAKKTKKEREKAAKRKLRLKEKRDQLLSTIPERLQALAAERETARANKQYSRADAIRDQCLKAGYRFNAGGVLVKVSDDSQHMKGDSKDSAPGDGQVKTAVSVETGGGDYEGKKKKESKAERLKRQAKESAGEDAVQTNGGDANGKKKKESKGDRLKRQAKEAASAEAVVCGETDNAGEDVNQRVQDGNSDAKTKRKTKKDPEHHVDDVEEKGGEKRSREGGDESQKSTSAKKIKVGLGQDDVQKAEVEVTKNKKKTKPKKGIVIGRALALEAGAAGVGGFIESERGGEAQDSSVLNPTETMYYTERAQSQVGADSGEAKAKKPPKREKKRTNVDVDGEQQQSSGKGRGRELLLARIKNKGWMRDSPATAPKQM